MNQRITMGILLRLGAVVLTASTGAYASPEGERAAKLEAGYRLVERAGTASWLSVEEREDLSREAHEAGSCGGYLDVTNWPESRVPVVTPLALYDRNPQFQPWVKKLSDGVSEKNLFKFVEKFSAFPTRHMNSLTSVKAMQWLSDLFKDVSKNRSDVEVALVKHSFRMPSMIARIKGSGPLANEVVVIGAHADSINSPLNKKGRLSRLAALERPAPGADDDASGVAAVFETFRVLVESGFKPNRTIEFMAYAGEEEGLLGSADIARAYRKQNRSVVGVLQLDMVLFPGSGQVMNLITTNTNESLNKFLAKLIDTYVKIPWILSPCGPSEDSAYPCSDHASWDRAGYPATFPFESNFNHHNPVIHSARDVIYDKLDFNFGAHFAKLGVAFLTELSSDKGLRFDKGRYYRPPFVR